MSTEVKDIVKDKSGQALVRKAKASTWARPAKQVDRSISGFVSATKPVSAACCGPNCCS